MNKIAGRMKFFGGSLFATSAFRVLFYLWIFDAIQGWIFFAIQASSSGSAYFCQVAYCNSVIVSTFYLLSWRDQETAKGHFGLRVKLPPVHLSITHSGGFSSHRCSTSTTEAVNANFS